MRCKCKYEIMRRTANKASNANILQYAILYAAVNYASRNPSELRETPVYASIKKSYVCAHATVLFLPGVSNFISES